MPFINEVRTKLIDKLKELFQLDQPELDFGFYRIMLAKSREITEFLDNDLLSQVQAALREYVPEEKAVVKKQLNDVLKNVADAGLDPEIAPKVIRLREKLAESVDLDRVELEVYNDLYRFFCRYYSEGDFISQRVYKEGVYAIPYEGEEVKLHWANSDQYYIKTSEYLRDYAFRLGTRASSPHDAGETPAVPGRIHFRLVDATEGAHNNVKEANGKSRLFSLADDDFLAIENDELVIRFQYKPSAFKQDELLQQAEASINCAGVPAPFTALFDNFVKSNGETADYSKLMHHLKKYTARNTFDYFIHKDLRTFLQRELDFFIKNEIMHLDDLEGATERRVEQYLSRLKAMRRVSKKIIDFLAQLEDFQKRLWLKKKFVVETNYSLTLDRVPEEFYTEIAANSAQREEWVKLFAIDEIKGKNGDLVHNGSPTYSIPLKKTFLAANPNLVLDTRFFDENFKERLLASIENFDDQCDGLLIHSDNFQALGLLQKRYKEQVKCVHIDPPYNTDTSGFLYKNGYRHASWLSMMDNRVDATIPLLNDMSSFICHIDENEYVRLHELLDSKPFIDMGTVIWDKRNPMTGGKGIAMQHEYVIWKNRGDETINLNTGNIAVMLDFVANLIKKHKKVNDAVRSEYKRWIDSNDALSGGEKAYCCIDDNGNVFRSVSLRAPEPRTNEKFHQPLIHPITKKPCPVPPNGFSRTPETLAGMMAKGEILFGKDDTTQPRQKRILVADKTPQLTSVLSDGTKGKADLDKLGVAFPYCHSVPFYRSIVSAASCDDSLILDYFAGSGTTGHAVINLNREDGGRRKYILVEMGDYFDTVLKPRIQKVIFARNWKDGKPQLGKPYTVSLQTPSLTINDVPVQDAGSFEKMIDKKVKAGEPVSFSTRTQPPVVTENRDFAPDNPFSGVSHCFKYLRLESYEDTLANIAFSASDDLKRDMMLESDIKEEYMLRYFLETESRESPVFWGTKAFCEPAEYRLKIKKPGSDETDYVKIDLLETFNYLLGLTVDTTSVTQRFQAEFKRDTEKRLRLKSKLKPVSDGKWWFRTITGRSLGGDKILIIWRNRPGGEMVDGMEEDNLVLDTWFESQGYCDTAGQFDVIYVNGTNNLANLQTTAGDWKIQLTEEIFHQAMFG